jgi:hypothetical protein
MATGEGRRPSVFESFNCSMKWPGVGLIKLEWEMLDVSLKAVDFLTIANEHSQVCGFCIKTWPIRDVSHKASECPRLKVINKHRGKFPPVKVENGFITWVNKEPTPDPEEVMQRAIQSMGEKLDVLVEQQAQMMEMLTNLQKDKKAEAEGSKASKKKAKAKAKEDKN